MIHKAHYPDVVLNLFNAHGLTGKNLTEVNFLASETDSAAMGHDNRLVVERIVEVRQSRVGTSGRLILRPRTSSCPFRTQTLAGSATAGCTWRSISEALPERLDTSRS